MLISHRIIWWVILPPAAFVICAWISDANYDAGISPSGVRDIAGFAQRFGEPHTVLLVERDGQNCYEIVGGVYPKFTFYVASNSPRYVFDEHGKFLEWCSGLNEQKTYEFNRRWVRSTNNPLSFPDVKRKLGL
jgi:hypothetical protein